MRSVEWARRRCAWSAEYELLTLTKSYMANVGSIAAKIINILQAVLVVRGSLRDFAKPASDFRS